MNQLNPVFIPGPTNLPESVRRVIDQPTIDHRSPAFASLLPQLFGDLKKVFATDAAKIFVFPGTGTGGWEATIANTLSGVIGCSRADMACFPISGFACVKTLA